ncbi:MAG: hypothetical protein H6673_10150 [Anaerolineales bacterium]|nr:hypothetical protein [Anaerolineales bacterium]
MPDVEATYGKADFSCITRLHSLDLVVVVALNKVDKLDPETCRTRLTELEERLARWVVPLCVQGQALVHTSTGNVEPKHTLRHPEPIWWSIGTQKICENSTSHQY